MKSRRVWVLGAFAAALALRLGVWVASHNRSYTFIQVDTLSYLSPGREFLTQGTYSSYSRPPVYSLFLAAVEKLVQPGNAAAPALVQIVLAMGTLGLAFRICSRLLGPKAAVFAAWLLALDLTSAILANQLLSETLFTFLLVVCLTGLLSWSQRSSLPWKSVTGAAILGAGFSALTLCRPIAVFLFLPVAVWMLLRPRVPARLSAVLLFCVLANAGPAAWVARNHAETGVYFLTSVSSINIYEFRGAWNVAHSEDLSLDATRESFARRSRQVQADEGWNEGELSRWRQSEGIRLLRDKPLLTLLQGWDGLVKMYAGISNAAIDRLTGAGGEASLEDAGSMINRALAGLSKTSPWAAALKLAAIAYLVLLYMGVAAAAVLGFRRLPRDAFAGVSLLAAVLVYFTLLSVGAETYARFRVPVAPILSLLSGAGWAWWLTDSRRRPGSSPIRPDWPTVS